MIRVVFFASIREALGKAEMEIEADRIETVHDVIARLGNECDAWKQALSGENLLTAVNQTMVDADHPVRSGDEVALFPPVTGG